MFVVAVCCCFCVLFVVVLCCCCSLLFSIVVCLLSVLVVYCGSALLLFVIPLLSVSCRCMLVVAFIVSLSLLLCC